MGGNAITAKVGMQSKFMNYEQLNVMNQPEMGQAQAAAAQIAA